MADVSRIERIFGRVLMWCGIALAIANFCLLVLPSSEQLRLLMNRLFYSSGLMISMGAWAAQDPRRSVPRAIIVGVLLQVALMAVRHGIRLAISY